MHTYDVYRGQEHHARVSVHDDGRKTWEYFSEWRDFYVKDHQEGIERAIDIWRNQQELTLSGFTIRQRPE
jgi:hypothetical protein